jgi:hypothetical protein
LADKFSHGQVLAEADAGDDFLARGFKSSSLWQKRRADERFGVQFCLTTFSLDSEHGERARRSCRQIPRDPDGNCGANAAKVARARANTSRAEIGMARLDDKARILEEWFRLPESRRCDATDAVAFAYRLLQEQPDTFAELGETAHELIVAWLLPYLHKRSAH